MKRILKEAAGSWWGGMVLRLLVANKHGGMQLKAIAAWEAHSIRHL